tara:strand:+ start:899 stop:1120 length:222 start_codon:yes stop_codon:yes gene_type:complete
MYKQVLDNIEEDYKDDIDFYRVNTETERKLSMMFGVRSLPTTLLVPSSGKPHLQPGSLNESQLKYYLDGLISK